MPRLKKNAVKEQPQQPSPGEKETPSIFTEARTGKTPDVEGAKKVLEDHVAQTTEVETARAKRSYKQELEDLKNSLANKNRGAELSKGLQRQIVWITNVLCERMPTPKPLTPIEEEMWSDAVGELLSKYWESFQTWAPEIGAGLCAIMIIGGRITKEKKPKLSTPAGEQ